MSAPTLIRFSILLHILIVLPHSSAETKPVAKEPSTQPIAADQIDGFEGRRIEGWTVRINSKLMKDEPALTEKAIGLLTMQLRQIRQVVPSAAVVDLQRVHLWINPEYSGTPPRAEYHPDAGWLREHGRNAMMARGVEFTNVRIFEAECRRMPCFVLHELAHAYHDQVLGFDRPDIIAAYEKAVQSKSYDAVERFHGDPARPNTIERAYAMTNYKEYFAESTESFFGRNDYFPFTREQLRRHDPRMFELLKRLWKMPEAGTASPGRPR